MLFKNQGAEKGCHDKTNSIYSFQDDGEGKMHFRREDG